MEEKIIQIKRDLLQASYEAGACHIGSALSCVRILVDLFYNQGYHPEQFFFGKASGVAAYYCILADLKYIEKTDVVNYLRQYPLPSVEVPGIRHSFGSVGHALPVALGNALAQPEMRFAVLLSDGDCQEGATLEAALMMAHHDPKNLDVYIDNNQLIACGPTEDILGMEPVWHYFIACHQNIHIVDTTKGDGVSFMEDDHHWHYKNLDEDTLAQALAELDHE